MHEGGFPRIGLEPVTKDNEFTALSSPGVTRNGNSRMLEPTPAMRNASAMLGTQGYSLTANENFAVMNCWLSPEGDMYPCIYKAHQALLVALGFSDDSEMEDAGWIKLTRLRWCVTEVEAPLGVTDAQWSTIARWLELNQYPVQVLYELQRAAV